MEELVFPRCYSLELLTSAGPSAGDAAGDVVPQLALQSLHLRHQMVTLPVPFQSRTPDLATNFISVWGRILRLRIPVCCSEFQIQIRFAKSCLLDYVFLGSRKKSNSASWIRMLLRMPFFAPPLLLQWQIVILESCMLHVAEQFHVYYVFICS